MACKKYIYAAGDTAWVTTFMEGIERSWKGINKTSLTNYDTTTVCAIDEGSVFEIAGSLYIATSETAISGVGATGVNYITAIGSTGGAVFAWSQDVPVWRKDYQGYYASIGSTTRVIGDAYYYQGSYILKTIRSDYNTKIKREYLSYGYIDTAYISGGDRYLLPASATSITNIALPDGSVISRFHAGEFSQSVGFSIEMQDTDIYDWTTTVATIAAGTASGGTTTSSIAHAIIDNYIYTYYLQVNNTSSTDRIITGIWIEYYCK